MTDKLSLYNNALAILGERKLASLSENREPRRLLDEVWDSGAIDFCLEQGLWNFAMRSAAISYDTDVTSRFGYQYAFSKPDDFIRLDSMCVDEYFSSTLTRYSDEAGYWWADHSELYIRYVSNSTQYGLDMGKWPQTFCRYVESYLAYRAMLRLTQSENKQMIVERMMKRALVDARSKDAQNEAVKFLPRGSWSMSRFGGSISNYQDE